ncbi:MAG: toxin-antitoxin system YwqK family antitoxin [Vibrio ordalii]|uniref:toxin-antitoxin system YwqK family antitoxin n=1 Tax=Vibrio ordalii TaxID=28174 RepID=UPI003F2E7EA2
MKYRKFSYIFTALLGTFLTSGWSYAADLGKLVHGPLVTNDGQELGFYKKENNVTARFASPPETEEDMEASINFYPRLFDSQYELGNVSVVAVFYQDLDLGGQDEIIVMYRDVSGMPHLRAWGADGSQMVPLTHFAAKLDKIAVSLDKFTVASVRKAVSKLLPQQYLITYSPKDLSDPLFAEVLREPDKYHHVLQGYFDEMGDTVANLEDASGYAISFPDKFIERINDKGEIIRYMLTMEFTRQGTCGMDELGFVISDLRYQDASGIVEGPSVYFGLSECMLMKIGEGQFHNNKREGEWSHYYRDGMGWSKGSYRGGFREGTWQEYEEGNGLRTGKYVHDEQDGEWQTAADSGGIIAIENYQVGVANGYWLRKKPTRGDESNWVTEEEGQYLNGKKEGAWKETMITEPRYAHYRNGLLHGELRVTQPNGQNREIAHYQQGLRHGERRRWFENGQLKYLDNYLHGQLKGASYFYWWDSGKLSSIENWKPGSPVNADLCQGLPSQAACDQRANFAEPLQEGEWRSFHQNGQLATISQRHNGKKVGAEYKFNHSGKLFSYELWDGNDYPVEDSRYDYSESDDLVHKPIRMSLLADTRLLKDGRKEQSTFHTGTNKLSRQNFWCTTSWSRGVVCGTEYWWYSSGSLSAVKQQHNNRKIESTSWDSDGSLDTETVKTSDTTFSDRSYYFGTLYSDSIRPATTYHDGDEDVVTADPSIIIETRRYDKYGNIVTFEEQQKSFNIEPMPKVGKYISE